MGRGQRGPRQRPEGALSTTTTLSVQVPKRMKACLDALAKEAGIAVSPLVYQILAEYQFSAYLAGNTAWQDYVGDFNERLRDSTGVKLPVPVLVSGVVINHLARKRAEAKLFGQSTLDEVYVALGADGNVLEPDQLLDLLEETYVTALRERCRPCIEKQPAPAPAAEPVQQDKELQPA